MNKIYGFGNALIDIEIKVSEEQLSEIKIEKGSMRHISKEDLDYFLKEFADKTLSTKAGGSIANSLYAANKHNISTHFSCSLGDDKYGKLFLESFDIRFCSVSFNKSDKPTGVCLIFITPDGERTMAAHLGANLDMDSKCLDEENLTSSEFLLFDNFSLSNTGGYITLEDAVSIKPSLKICFGISDSSLVRENQKQIMNIFKNKIDILFGNEREVKTFIDALNVKPINILTTLGEMGAKYNHLMIEATQTRVVNTNGAGDALIGSFLANIGSVEESEALERAVKYASEVCSTNGPRLT